MRGKKNNRERYKGLIGRGHDLRLARKRLQGLGGHLVSCFVDFLTTVKNVIHNASFEPPHIRQQEGYKRSETERKPFNRPANLCLSQRMLIVQEDVGFQRKTFNFLFTGNVI